jgi:transcriptional regulator with XRE-family HTH domain
MDAPVPPTLGKRIGSCRERLGWTQKRLAEEAGISVTFLSELENEKRMPGADVLLRLADALQTSLDYLAKGRVASAPPWQSLVIPSELAELAEEEGWSLGDTSDLLKFRQMVVARRSRSGTAEDPERRLTREEWLRLSDWYRKSPL